MRSSIFTYLAPEKSIPMFYSDEITIPVPYEGTQALPSLKWGTIIKMFEYDMKGYKTSILLDLNYHISLLLFRPGLPIRFYERRGYGGHTLESTMAGLHVRLQDDPRGNLEHGFPTSHDIRVMGEHLKAIIYAFQRGKDEKYRKNEGIIFAINGQTHGVLDQRFFSRKRVGMSYLADTILVVVDATNISARAREDLFMNSRDRIRSGDLFSAIEQNLEEIISDHQGLRELRERRRREDIEQKLADSKPLQEILDDLLRKSPSLSALFIKGKDIGNPTKSRLVGQQDTFEGKTHPTFFKIFKKDQSREVQLGRRFRIQFNTDVVNDYFNRDRFPGRFSLYQDGRETADYILNLWNGIATLSITLPSDSNVGDTFDYFAKVDDDTLVEFINEFTCQVIPKVDDEGYSNGNRKKTIRR
jgi:hypothetical protein